MQSVHPTDTSAIRRFKSSLAAVKRRTRFIHWRESGEYAHGLTAILLDLKESIVDPNRQIAKGFETVVLALKDGTTVSGVLKEENATEIRLITPEAQYITVAKKDVEARETGKSAMPEDAIKHLSKSELRDLVEFLANLK